MLKRAEVDERLFISPNSATHNMDVCFNDTGWASLKQKVYEVAMKGNNEGWKMNSLPERHTPEM
jgi:hypothetical protein